jgi:membrane-bound ClpP family serine protease
VLGSAKGASPERPVQAGESAQESAIAALDVLAVPEIAYLLLAAGLLCLIVRLADPDLGWFSGAVGSALLLLAGAGLLAMPVRPAGVLMLTFAATSLCMEVLVLPGFGLYAAGAAFSLVLAGAFLGPDPTSVDPAVMVPIAGTVTVVTYWAGRRSWRYVRDRPFDPSPRLVGRGTMVLTASGRDGFGVVSGHLWALHAESGDLQPGQTVRVIEANVISLVVRPAPGLRLS